MTKAPKHLQEKVPANIREWIPFAMAALSIGIAGWGPLASFSRGFGGGSSYTLLRWGLPILIFGLLTRLRRPNDAWARYVIGAGSVLCLPGALSHLFGGMFSFKLGFIFGIHNLLYGLILLLAVACFGLVPTERQVPKLRSLHAFAPMATAILIVWIPVQALLFALAGMAHWSMGLGSVFTAMQMLIGELAFVGVFVLTAPMAYEFIVGKLDNK